MSDISVPKTVRALSISRKDPARYISWFMRDSKSNGPVVGKLRTTLVIAHRLSTIRHADLILVLNDGVVIESGNFDSLIKANGQFKNLWDLQQQAHTKENHTSWSDTPHAINGDRS